LTRRQVAVVGLVAAVAFIGISAFLLRAPSNAGLPPVAYATSSSTPAATAAPGATGALPSRTPVPTPVLVPDPLTGRLVTPVVAARHPIAVMIDDLFPARPQSGLSAASIVWQAPAEGGIPRYMAIFQDRIPRAVGPVRSARYYFIAWAAQWRSVYAHAGGSPQALQTLSAEGRGQLVYNADQFKWGNTYFHRIASRSAPHNLYTDGASLWRLAARIGATNQPIQPAWTFAPDAPLAARPIGGRIAVAYPANAIVYRYDRATNTYLRSVTGERAETDAATGTRIAPKNVIVMRVSFGPLNDSEPAKGRLEAKVVGSGQAWIATDGRTIAGTWRKTSLTGPIQFFDATGQPVTLTVGQTFINVMAMTDSISIRDGAVPSSTSNAPAGSPTPDASG
jgi:hypothetical protein